MDWVICWRTALAMSSLVANHLPHSGPLIFGMRLKSQSEMLGEYGVCSNSSQPQRCSSCSTHSALVLHCRAGLLQCPWDLDVFPKCHIVSVAPGSHCSTVWSLFCHEERSSKQGHPWHHTQRSPSFSLLKDSDGTSGFLEVQHVTTPRTKASALLCMT